MTITEYILNIFLVGLVVLQLRGHKLTVARMVVPVAVTLWVASQFLHGLPVAGDDRLLEATLGVTGAVLGAAAGFATNVRLVGQSAFAKAGAFAAVLWVVGIGARMAFSLWVTHGGAPAITRFSVAHHITSGAAWAAGFIFMAIAEVAVRTTVIWWKGRRTGAVIERGGLLRRSAAAA
jgi:hypothetical protein